MTLPLSSSITRRRIASTIAWSCVAMHDGGPDAVDLVEQAHDLDRRRRVEVPGRLVGQQHERPVHARAGDRDALLLAAGELVGEVVELVAEADELEDLGHALVDHVLGLADHLERERDVLEHGLVLQELEVLEHRPDVPAQVRHLPRW